MNAMTFSWFASFLAIVSISEARLGHLIKRGVSGKQKILYSFKKAKEMAIQVSQDLNANYRVTSELPETKLRNMTTELLNVLIGARTRINHPDLNIPMSNVDLTGLDVPNRLFNIRKVELLEGKLTDSLILSIDIPKIAVTFSSKACRMPTPRSFLSCVRTYVFENTAVNLQANWPILPQPKEVMSASILKFEPRNITCEISVGLDLHRDITVPKESPVWQHIVFTAKSIVPDNLRTRKLLKDFTESLLW